MGVCQVPQRVLQAVTLTLNVSGPGYVTVNGRSCRGACTVRYWRGTMLQLRAYGKLAAWGGACAGTGSRCQVGAYKDLAGADPVINAAFS
jgi:hypothetical protein